MSDPYLVLELDEDADDAAVEAAYLAGIRRYPPERDPQRFEALRRAYELLRDRSKRIAHAVFDTTPPTLTDILDRAAPLQAPARPQASLFAALLRGEE